MTEEAKIEMMKGLLQGANLEHAQINMVVESGATVNYYAADSNVQWGSGSEEVADEGNDDVTGLLAVSAECVVALNEEEIVERLRPIFYNNEGDVRTFLKEISGMQPNNITDLVNTWVKDQRISNYGNSRKGVLWEILNKAGLYTKSRQNWCRRVY